MSSKSPNKPTGKPAENEKVVPLHKSGLLAPKSRWPRVAIGFGVIQEADGDYFVWRNADGSIERTKITDDDD